MGVFFPAVTNLLSDLVKNLDGDVPARVLAVDESVFRGLCYFLLRKWILRSGAFLANFRLDLAKLHTV